MTLRIVLAALGIAVFAWAPPAAAVEMFGVTPSAGAVGDGRLTAQVTVEGTLSCLRWPNATFYEHLKHTTAGWDPDRAKNGWLKPYYGAQANSGAFAGVRYVDGAQVVVRWLREGSPQFAYASETSNRLVGTYSFATTLGAVEVEEDTFNVPDAPALIRAYRLRAAPAKFTDFQIIAFVNPALRNEHDEYSPWDDTQKDDEPRFGSFFDPSNSSILTALPRTVSPAMRAAASAAVGADVQGIAAFLVKNVPTWGEGVYLVQGGSEPAAGWQVGTDATLVSSGSQDAFTDAGDGTLSRSNAAVKYETTALAFPLATVKPVAWYAVFATQPAAARLALRDMRKRTVAEWSVASDDWWAAWLKGTVLPTGQKERAFARRALISLRTGYDPESGAIVASTSCEPPYNVDWPRDGAFFQYLLDMNGKFAEAGKHARFYSHMQNKTKRLYGPAGSFPMNAFADYVPGGPIDFEIDQIGFVLWAYRTHAAFLSVTSPTEAYGFLQEVRESAQLAADLLVTCKDAKGLQCPANEDDHPEMTQTLHGAITVWLGLRSAADIFAAVGEYRPEVLERADELAAAIRKHFPPTATYEQGVGAGSLAWATWPAAFWTDGDDIAAARAHLDDAVRSRVLNPDAESTSYQTKETIALLMAPLRTAGTERFVDEVHAKYLDEILTPGTLHLAELTSYYDVDGDGQKEWVNRVATPHIWGQALLYFSLVAREHPELLQAPPIERMELADAAPSSGCDCRTGGVVDPWSLFPAAVILACLLVRRRLRG